MQAFECHDCRTKRNICPESGMCTACCGAENTLFIYAGQLPPRDCKCR